MIRCDSSHRTIISRTRPAVPPILAPILKYCIYTLLRGLGSRVGTIGERRKSVSRAGFDLACCGAGHQADPFLTGRQDALPRSALEGSVARSLRSEEAVILS